MTSSNKPSLKQIRGVERRAISVSPTELVKIEPVAPGRDLPLLIQPADQAISLSEWAANNQGLIETYLTKHGAILFRNFAINDEAFFERFVLTLCTELFKENGEHTPVSQNGHVQTPIFYPPEKQLLWHNENSFNYEWPLRIWFGCVKPADHGGETPIVDSRQVFARIDPKIVDRFKRKHVLYMRNYNEGVGLSWQTVFKTDSRAEVEALCRKSRMDFEWKDGDRLRTRSIRPAVIQHPTTGEWSWFNQAQHWHVACLDQDTRDSLLGLFKEEDLPRNCYYGDGSPIEAAVMDEILGVYRELEVSLPWQQGDVMMLDNVLTAHGRNPFGGTRRILVAIGEMRHFDL